MRAGPRKSEQDGATADGKRNAADQRGRSIAPCAGKHRALLQGIEQAIANQRKRGRHDQPEDFLKQEKQQVDEERQFLQFGKALGRLALSK